MGAIAACDLETSSENEFLQDEFTVRKRAAVVRFSIPGSNEDIFVETEVFTIEAIFRLAPDGSILVVNDGGDKCIIDIPIQRNDSEIIGEPIKGPLEPFREGVFGKAIFRKG